MESEPPLATGMGLNSWAGVLTGDGIADWPRTPVRVLL